MSGYEPVDSTPESRTSSITTAPTLHLLGHACLSSVPVDYPRADGRVPRPVDAPAVFKAGWTLVREIRLPEQRQACSSPWTMAV